MQRFCHFESHDYMDMYPEVVVQVIKGNTLEDVLTHAKEFAVHMNKEYSGGTTKFVRIMEASEAREFLDKQIAKIKHPDSADKDWIENVNNLYNQCYNTEV